MSLAPSFEDYMSGYWPLDDASGSTFDDVSGNGNDGSLFNMGAGNWIDAVLSGGLNFDGGNEYGSVPDDPDLDSILTFSCWVNPISQNSHATFHHCIVAKDATFKNGLFIDYNKWPNRFTFHQQSDVGSRSTMEYLIQDYTAWHHLAGVFKDGRAWLYVNGRTLNPTQANEAKKGHPWTDGIWTTRWWNQSLDNNQSSSMWARPLTIGGIGPTQANRYSRIKLDDVRAFDIALDDYEVGVLCAGGRRKWHLGPTSESAVELYPDQETYKKGKSQNRFDHRTKTGKLFQYNFGDLDRISFDCQFVQESDGAIVNSWWDENTDLRLFVQSDYYTEVNCGRLINQESPFRGYNKMWGTENFKGNVLLEGY